MTHLPFLYAVLALRRPLLIIVLVVICASVAVAQAGTAVSVTDRYTPSGSAPGAPTGSYPLSGFDNINLYNGHLSFALPLLGIGGRGEAGYTAAHSVERKWRSVTRRYYVGPGTPGSSEPVYEPTADDWQGREAGFSPGVMVGRPSRDRHPSGSGGTGFGAPALYECQTLTSLTFIGADGTEIAFRDAKSDGRPYKGVNGYTYSRGNVFITRDGSAATFVSEQPINDIACNDHDVAIMLGYKRVYPTGYLIWKNGVRYRVEGGYVKWISDRNGNIVDLQSGTGAFDVLGRLISFNGGISYKGFEGATRSVQVITSPLSETLRYDVPSIKTYGQSTGLFPEMAWPGANNTFNPPAVTSAIVLPDNRQYTLKYNAYGELARIELPSGGAIEYDHDGGNCMPSPCSGVIGMEGYPIYRRVVARRVYNEGGVGTNYDSQTIYSKPAAVYDAAVGGWDSKVTVTEYDRSGSVLAISDHTFRGSASESLTSTTFKWYEPYNVGLETRTEVFSTDGNRTLLRRVDYRYENYPHQLPPYDGNLVDVDRPQDPYLKEAKTTFADANLVSKQVFVNDRYGNRTDVYEYVYGTGEAGPLVRHTHTDYVSAGLYTDHTGAHLRALPTTQKIYPVDPNTGVESVTPAAHVETLYDEYGLTTYNNAVSGWAAPAVTQRGNATTQRVWVNTSNSWLDTHSTYDQVGNVISSTDAKNNTTQFSHHDAFAGGVHCTLPDNSACYTYAFLTQTASASPDPANTGFGSSAPLVTSSVYDYDSGNVFSSTDANGKVTSYRYNDPLERLRRVDRPDGGWTTYEYGRSNNAGVMNDYVRAVTALDDSRWMESYQFSDGLGRPNRSFLNDGGAPTFITTDIKYDGLGRVSKSSNPYRTASSFDAVNPSGEWAENYFDALGRMVRVRTPDGAETKTGYDGARVLTTDQAGRQRLSRTDALGRLTDVWEITGGTGTESVTFGNPQVTLIGFRTSYAQDVFGNVRKVEQGAQSRYFMYDSLSRLIRAKNPEQAAGSVASNITDPLTDNSQWSMAYGYDQNNNLTARVDARNITTSYQYDNINRNTTITYTNDPQNTPAVERHYDGATNGKGRFWYNVTLGPGGSHTAVDEYDAMGRPRVQRQHFATASNMGGGSPWGSQWWSPAYKVTRSFDKAGNVASQAYPSGHTVTYNYDAAGRPGDFNGATALSGNLGDGVTRSYASQISYDEAGRMREERFGARTPLYHKLHYNVRGQLYDVRLSTVPRANDQWNWNRGALLSYYSAAEQSASSNAARALSGTENNGNLKRVGAYVPLTDGDTYNEGAAGNFYMAQSDYVYDALNRLSSVAESAGTPAGLGAPHGAQAYKYDRWGNREIKADETYGTGFPEPQFELNPQTNHEVAEPSNRLYAPGDAGRAPAQKLMRYDAAGNLTHDAHTGGGGRSYDAENRMTAAWGYSGLVGGPFQSLYTYDADGRRVRRKADTGEVWQVYGLDGELLAEYQAGAATNLATKEYGYRGGELLMTAASGDDGRMLRFLYKLYNALGRGPDATEQQQGMAALTAAAAQGQSQLLQAARNLAAALFNSGEYAARGRTDAQFVSDLYWSYPQREPDAGGYQAWLNAVALYGRAATRDGFANSAEFDALAGRVYGVSGGEDERTELFIHKLYTSLARDASGAELAARVTRINHAEVQGRVQMVAEAKAVGRELFQSPEYANRARSDREYVRDLYVAFLDREPDQGGWDAWTNAVPGAGRTVVMHGFADSGEFENRASTLHREVYWIVADHLGTPRMLADRSGNLAGVKRHDYLPFGEKLDAGIGGRTAAQGYAPDGLRKQFTGKERDVETGLDYFIARYYSSQQGRFVSSDYIDSNPAHLFTSFERSSALPYATLLNPQTLNHFTYAYNNPLSYVDPDGHSGHKKPIPGHRRYSYRADRSNVNDSPNFHIFDKGGRREIGRVAVQGEPGAITFEWSGNVPQSVRSDMEVVLREQGVQPRPPVHPRQPNVEASTASEAGGTGSAGRGRGRARGGPRARATAGLLWAALIVDVLSMVADQKEAEQKGYYTEESGQIVIIDLKKAVQIFPQGQSVSFAGHIFRLEGDTFVSTTCSGCTLQQRPNGQIYIRTPMAE